MANDFQIPSGDPFSQSGGGGGTPPLLPNVTTPGGSAFSGSTFQSIAMSYQQAAEAYGFSVSQGQAQTLIDGNVSVDEFTQRLKALDNMNANRDLLDQFEKVLKADYGVKKFDTADRLGFIMGTSGKEWDDVWNKAASRGAAVSAGFDIAKGPADMNILPKQLDTIRANLGIEGAQPGDLMQQLQQTFTALAQATKTTLPISRYYGFGIKKADIIAAQTAGNEQAQERIAQALSTKKAADTTQVAEGGSARITPNRGASVAGLPGQ